MVKEGETERHAEAANDGLEHLVMQAQNIDAGGRPLDAPRAIEAAASITADELLGALTMARLMVAPMFAWWPEFPVVWSDAAIKGIAEGGGAVMDKHGWSVGAVLGEFGPYIALVGAVAPPSFVTWKAIKSREKGVRNGSAEQAKN